MSDELFDNSGDADEGVADTSGGPGTSGEPDTATAVAPVEARPKPRTLPPYKLLLHNDDVNDMAFVVEKIVELTQLTFEEAIERMIEAHQAGLALLLVTHRERAELYCEQFATYNLTATIEPA